MATAPARDRVLNIRLDTSIPVHSSPGPAPPLTGRTGPNPVEPTVSTTTALETSRTTLAPRSWGATNSVRSADRGRTTTGRDGGATKLRSTHRSSCLLITFDHRSRWVTR